MSQKTNARKKATIKRALQSEASVINNKALIRIFIVAIVLFFVIAFECYFFTWVIYMPDFEFKALISSTAAIGILILFIIEIIASHKINKLHR